MQIKAKKAVVQGKDGRNKSANLESTNKETNVKDVDSKWKKQDIYDLNPSKETSPIGARRINKNNHPEIARSLTNINYEKMEDEKEDFACGSQSNIFLSNKDENVSVNQNEVKLMSISEKKQQDNLYSFNELTRQFHSTRSKRRLHTFPNEKNYKKSQESSKLISNNEYSNLKVENSVKRTEVVRSNVRRAKSKTIELFNSQDDDTVPSSAEPAGSLGKTVSFDVDNVSIVNNAVICKAVPSNETLTFTENCNVKEKTIHLHPDDEHVKLSSDLDPNVGIQKLSNAEKEHLFQCVEDESEENSIKTRGTISVTDNLSANIFDSSENKEDLMQKSFISEKGSKVSFTSSTPTSCTSKMLGKIKSRKKATTKVPKLVIKNVDSNLGNSLVCDDGILDDFESSKKKLPPSDHNDKQTSSLLNESDQVSYNITPRNKFISRKAKSTGNKSRRSKSRRTLSPIRRQEPSPLVLQSDSEQFDPDLSLIMSSQVEPVSKPDMAFIQDSKNKRVNIDFDLTVVQDSERVDFELTKYCKTKAIAEQSKDITPVSDQLCEDLRSSKRHRSTGKYKNPHSCNEDTTKKGEHSERPGIYFKGYDHSKNHCYLPKFPDLDLEIYADKEDVEITIIEDSQMPNNNPQMQNNNSQLPDNNRQMPNNNSQMQNNDSQMQNNDPQLQNNDSQILSNCEVNNVATVNNINNVTVIEDSEVYTTQSSKVDKCTQESEKEELVCGVAEYGKSVADVAFIQDSENADSEHTLYASKSDQNVGENKDSATNYNNSKFDEKVVVIEDKVVVIEDSENGNHTSAGNACVENVKVNRALVEEDIENCGLNVTMDKTIPKKDLKKNRKHENKMNSDVKSESSSNNKGSDGSICKTKDQQVEVKSNTAIRQTSRKSDFDDLFVEESQLSASQIVLGHKHHNYDDYESDVIIPDSIGESGYYNNNKKVHLNPGCGQLSYFKNKRKMTPPNNGNEIINMLPDIDNLIGLKEKVHNKTVGQGLKHMRGNLVKEDQDVVSSTQQMIIPNISDLNSPRKRSKKKKVMEPSFPECEKASDKNITAQSNKTEVKYSRNETKEVEGDNINSLAKQPSTLQVGKSPRRSTASGLRGPLMKQKDSLPTKILKMNNTNNNDGCNNISPRLFNKNNVELLSEKKTISQTGSPCLTGGSLKKSCKYSPRNKYTNDISKTQSGARSISLKLNEVCSDLTESSDNVQIKIINSKTMTDNSPRLTNSKASVLEKKGVKNLESADFKMNQGDLYASECTEVTRNKSLVSVPEVDAGVLDLNTNSYSQVTIKRSRNTKLNSPDTRTNKLNVNDGYKTPDVSKSRNSISSDVKTKKTKQKLTISPITSPVFKAKRSRKSDVDCFDFSFLEDESSDLYSQVKKRERRKKRAHSLPDSIGSYGAAYSSNTSQVNFINDCFLNNVYPFFPNE